MTRHRKLTTRTIALVGVLSAVSLVLLFAAGVIPSGWIGITAVAGLTVAIAVSAAGYAAGAFCWLVSGLLGLLLIPAKQVPILFLCLFGLYPLLKNLLERLKLRILEYLGKLVFFNLVFFAFYFLAYALFFQGMSQDWSYGIPLLPILWVAANVIFLIYDFAFTKVMGLIQVRLVDPMRRRWAGR